MCLDVLGDTKVSGISGLRHRSQSMLTTIALSLQRRLQDDQEVGSAGKALLILESQLQAKAPSQQALVTMAAWRFGASRLRLSKPRPNRIVSMLWWEVIMRPQSSRIIARSSIRGESDEEHSIKSRAIRLRRCPSQSSELG